MRVLAWSELDPAARQQLLGRGVTAIFDPELRESIELIVEDVRENGDAVRRGLRAARIAAAAADRGARDRRHVAARGA